MSAVKNRRTTGSWSVRAMAGLTKANRGLASAFSISKCRGSEQRAKTGQVRRLSATGAFPVCGKNNAKAIRPEIHVPLAAATRRASQHLPSTLSWAKRHARAHSDSVSSAPRGAIPAQSLRQRAVRAWSEQRAPALSLRHVNQRIGDAGFAKTFATQLARIAFATGASIRRRVVATVRKRKIDM